MTFQEKLSYLWEYYRIHAAITIAVIALLIYIIYEIMTPHVKTQFYAAMINTAVDAETLQSYSDSFADYLNLDPKTQSVNLNSEFYFSNENDYSSGMGQVLSTYLAAGEIDVIIAPESDFKSFVKNGVTAKLSDELPTDIYSELTDYFYISDTAEDTNKNAYGIYLKDTDLFKDITYNGQPYVLGIVASYPHVENTVDFIRFLIKDRY